MCKMVHVLGAVLLLLSNLCFINGLALTLKAKQSTPKPITFTKESISRRLFFGTTAAAAATVLSPPPVLGASPEIFTTEKGVKYAITKESGQKRPVTPNQGDIVAIEYTGYLTNGKIFDATHSEGKSNALLFKLGSTAVIPGLNDIVSNMVVGQKVQAIIPPSLAFGDDGICIESGECLIKPGSTLVYDVLLKKSSIPPP